MKVPDKLQFTTHFFTDPDFQLLHKLNEVIDYLKAEEEKKEKILEDLNAKDK